MVPSVEQNRIWGSADRWDNHVVDWSGGFGGPDAQWYGTLLPRVHPFLPASTILEIACGHGRWTHYLKDHAERLIAVDLNQECIDACRNRFAGQENLSFVANDGMSLSFVEDRSIDFAFSFDSLVHVDRPVMAAYLGELSRVLADDGVAFLHHSNLGAIRLHRMAGVPRLGGLLRRLGLLDQHSHWRDPGVSADVVSELAAQHGLCCVSQELINWGDTRRPIDCLTVLVRATSTRARPTVRVINTQFLAESRRLMELAEAHRPPRT